jgi:hypothetical protein
MEKEKERFSWKLLKQNKCPRCRSMLDIIPKDGIFGCINKRCDFAISEHKFSEIVMDMNKNVIELQSEYRQGEEVEDLLKGNFD